jgi:exosome complex component CSL4
MDELVVPGQRIAAEEEFKPGQNTYVEEGVIYSSAYGVLRPHEGTINVENAGRAIRLVDKGMTVIGRVTDDMRSVIFVSIDPITMGSKEYLALKDGKIIPDRPRPGARPMRMHGVRENSFAETKFVEEKKDSPVGIGDTIIAKVLFNDKDSYTLGIRGDEFGVINANCDMCGERMGYDAERGMLVCGSCGRRLRRKVSIFYNDPKHIKDMFS